ncbi:hypothetical protein [Methyloterricola oryzae]|uniref:hypothetical protein n=1 Tax=Methyloterricola oryzae TaxID=1495050 RepID=UPI0005EBB00A|nr:hypothetical protein [Methyloterricola oryzae]
MNTSIRHIITAAAIVSASATGNAWAHGAQDAGMHPIADAAIVYNNTAYAQTQSSPPQTASAGEAATVLVLYVDQAHGPAIYSYPGRAEVQAIESCAAPRWVVQ